MPPTELLEPLDPTILFVTPGEVKHLDELAEDLARVEFHRVGLTGTKFEERMEESRAKYLAHPTDENWLAYCRLEHDLVILRATPRLSTFAEVALANLIRDKLVPFVAPIIDRGIAAARDQLAATQKTENARHEALIGQSMRQNSEIVEFMTHPLKALQELLHRANQTPVSASWRPIIAALKSHVKAD